MLRSVTLNDMRTGFVSQSFFNESDDFYFFFSETSLSLFAENQVDCSDNVVKLKPLDVWKLCELRESEEA